ncbi:hypothetical protein ER308_05000 [Egibacter rhizosphaerae]|uniref:Uncharacterized protein n=1 Tax=Egibacter rhizosphaerae TaxID=1670831 RepID=A0A411YCJ7_9ACTN|nr:hypothetical protein [Egibacter rhizosphaerae]QBI18961.1 hypothetical protein ER308_05000 [Egibacter rhizosphaerae]
MSSSSEPRARPESRGSPDVGPPQAAPHRRRWLVLGGVLVAVALGVALFLLVRQSPGAQLGAAIDNTLEQGTARTEITGTVTDVPIVDEVTLTVAEGELDLDGQRALLERELPLVSDLNVPGIGAVSDVEVLFADGGAWARVPVDQLGWVQVRAPDEAATARIAEEETEVAPGLGNPLGAFALLRAIETSPEEIAADEVEEIDGENGTRFRVLADLDALERQLGDEAEGLVDAARRIARDDHLVIDLWVDDQQRIERITYEGTVDLAGVTEVDIETEMRLFDFGATVDVERPDEEDVLAVDQLPELDFDLEDLDPLGTLRRWIEELPLP